jgi:hypothetical protein
MRKRVKTRNPTRNINKAPGARYDEYGYQKICSALIVRD